MSTRAGCAAHMGAGGSRPLCWRLAKEQSRRIRRRRGSGASSYHDDPDSRSRCRGAAWPEVEGVRIHRRGILEAAESRPRRRSVHVVRAHAVRHRRRVCPGSNSGECSTTGCGGRSRRSTSCSPASSDSTRGHSRRLEHRSGSARSATAGFDPGDSDAELRLLRVARRQPDCRCRCSSIVCASRASATCSTTRGPK